MSQRVWLRICSAQCRKRIAQPNFSKRRRNTKTVPTGMLTFLRLKSPNRITTNKTAEKQAVADERISREERLSPLVPRIISLDPTSEAFCCGRSTPPQKIIDIVRTPVVRTPLVGTPAIPQQRPAFLSRFFFSLLRASRTKRRCGSAGSVSYQRRWCGPGTAGNSARP